MKGRAAVSRRKRWPVTEVGRKEKPKVTEPKVTVARDEKGVQGMGAGASPCGVHVQGVRPPPACVKVRPAADASMRMRRPTAAAKKMVLF